jgi:DHA1 family bicyclomycin/chloramphenicol resistance-like MFS transporter
MLAAAMPRLTPRPDSLVITVLLTVLVAVGSFSTSIYTPSMPSLAASFGTSPSMVKLTLSLFLAGFGLAQLAYGPLSDRFGRRPTLLAGLVVYVAGSLACTIAPTVGAMIVARFVQGVGACAGMTLGRAVVRDVHGRSGSARVYAWITAATALAPAIGPTVGGHVHVWFGWRGNFVLLTALGAVLLASCWRLLGETVQAPDRDATRLGPMLRNYRHLLGDRRYLGYTVAAGFVYAALFAWIAAAPFLFVEQLGMSPAVYGVLTLTCTACYILGSVGTARLTPRLGLDPPVRWGSLIALLGGAVMALLVALAPFGAVELLGPMMLFNLGLGMVLPNSLAGAMIPFPRIAGTASALLGFVQMAMSMGATLAMAALPRGSALAMAGTIAVLSLLSFLSHHFIVRRPHRPAATGM